MHLSPNRVFAFMLALILLLPVLPIQGKAEESQSSSVPAQVKSADTFWNDIKPYEVNINSEDAKTFINKIYAKVSEMKVSNLTWDDSDTFSFDLPSGIHCIYDYETRKAELNINGKGKNYIETIGTQKGAGSAKDVLLVGPYYGYDNSFTDFYRNEAATVANATGGTATVLSGTAATPAAIKARLAQKRDVVVFFDSHGASENGTSYLLVRSSDGITSSDLQNRWAASISGVYGIDANCMTSGQTTQLSNCFFWIATCEGMMRNGLSVPFVNCGAAAVYGYSKSVSFVGDYAFAGAFWRKFLEGATIADAIAYMKQQCGTTDGYGINAYPIVVSPEDPYPANVNTNQTVHCSWTLFANSIFYITYDANGGQNEPEKQKIEADENSQTATVTITNTVPYKFPYTFSGWGIENNGIANYQPGDTITISENTTLYAVWYVSNTINLGQNALSVRYANVNEYRKFSPQADGEYTFTSSESSIKTTLLASNSSEVASGQSFTVNLNKGNNYYLCFTSQTPQDFTLTISGSESYTLSYNADGSDIAPAPQSGTASYIVSDTIPEIFGKNFLGWSKSANSDTVEYLPGDMIVLDSDTTLYAVWAEPYEINAVSTVIDPFYGAKRYFKFTAQSNGEYEMSSDNAELTVYDIDGSIIASGKSCKFITESGKSYIICVSAEDTSVLTVTPPVSLGDVNGDGKINTADATCILKYSAGILPFTDDAKTAADVNCNGLVNTADAVVILKYAAGMINVF